MDQTPETNSKSWKRQLLIAKLLLRTYGILHEFHVRQLECYPIACCKIALDGQVEIDADAKSVTYQIFTSRFYNKTEDKKLKPKHRLILKIATKFGVKKYKEELSLATVNLNTWTKELLWGDETKIKVMIDGRSQTAD